MSWIRAVGTTLASEWKSFHVAAEPGAAAVTRSMPDWVILSNNYWCQIGLWESVQLCTMQGYAYFESQWVRAVLADLQVAPQMGLQWSGSRRHFLFYADGYHSHKELANKTGIGAKQCQSPFLLFCYGYSICVRFYGNKETIPNQPGERSIRAFRLLTRRYCKGGSLHCTQSGHHMDLVHFSLQPRPFPEVHNAAQSWCATAVLPCPWCQASLFPSVHRAVSPCAAGAAACV